MLEEALEDKVDEELVFVITFCDSWQIEDLHEYNSTIFMDSTHSTCYLFADREQKLFVHTILVKHIKVGCGVPAAFMITIQKLRGR